MPATSWMALVHLNYGCALAASHLSADGQTLEFARPQHGEAQILFNSTVAAQNREALQPSVILLAQMPLATDGESPWRDEDCRRTIELTMPAVERFCGELQSRHDSLRDENGRHAKPIETCDCDMSNLHRVLVNSIEFARGRLLG